jgi:hypothetical protein
METEAEAEDQATAAKNDSYRFIHSTIAEIIPKLAPEDAEKLKGVLHHLDLLLKETVKKASRDAMKQMQKENELNAVARSVMVYNINKIQVDKTIYDRAPMEEVLTEELLAFTRHRITVQDVVTFGRDDKGVPTMARVLLGSRRQRAILYRLLGEMGRGAKMAAADTMRPLSFRDMFPRELIEDSKANVQKGLGLKRSGNVHSFRVIAQGVGCVPVLQVRYKPGERWIVWNDAAPTTGANAVELPKPQRVRKERQVPPEAQAMLRGRDPEDLIDAQYMPAVYRREHVMDPEHRGKVEMADDWLKRGNKNEAIDEWVSERDRLKEELINYRGDIRIKDKMQEIYDSYIFAMSKWMDKL